MSFFTLFGYIMTLNSDLQNPCSTYFFPVSYCMFPPTFNGIWACLMEKLAEKVICYLIWAYCDLDLWCPCSDNFFPVSYCMLPPTFNGIWACLMEKWAEKVIFDHIWAYCDLDLWPSMPMFCLFLPCVLLHVSTNFQWNLSTLNGEMGEKGNFCPYLGILWPWPLTFDAHVLTISSVCPTACFH